MHCNGCHVSSSSRLSAAQMSLAIRSGEGSFKGSNSYYTFVEANIIRSTNFGGLDSYYATCIIFFLSVIGSKKMRNFEGVRSYYTFFYFLLEEQMRTSAQEL